GKAVVQTLVASEAHIGRSADGIRAFDPELVARIPRQVKHDAGVDRTAPYGLHRDTGETGGRHDEVVAVVVAADLVQSARDLRRAPGLIDPEIADDIGNLLCRVVAPPAAHRVESGG